VTLGYWDYQARATWQVADRDALGVFGFGSHDYLATKQSSNDATSGGSGQPGTSGSAAGGSGASDRWREQLVNDFHRLDLRYDRTLSDGRLRVALTLGYDSQGAEPADRDRRSVAQAPAPRLRPVDRRLVITQNWPHD
jgi:hypothetical protein